MIDQKYFLEHQNEFNRKSREHECEVPKGDCWKMTVQHNPTGDLYTYYEEDRYDSLQDQISDGLNLQFGLTIKSSDVE